MDGAGDSPGIRLTPPPKVAPLDGRRPHAYRGWLYASLIALGLLGLGGALWLILPWAVERQPNPEKSTEAGTETQESRDGQSVESLEPKPPATQPAASPTPSQSNSRATSSPQPRSGSETVGSESEAFGVAMAEALAAADAGDWARATVALERAAEERPDAPELSEFEARIRAAQTQRDLLSRRDLAASHVEAERWQAAVAEYRAVLETDSTLSFAREGLAVAESRARLSGLLDAHLERPDRLSAPAVLEEAHQILTSARSQTNPGPKLRSQIESLEKAVALAVVPVRVALVSDDRTQVTVNRVGTLGSFGKHELELRPGTYTVVGTRSGYRDVRHVLEVSPGVSPEPLEVRCQEKI